MPSQYGIERQPRTIIRNEQGALKSYFELPHIGPGYIYFNEEALEGANLAVQTPLGLILVHGIELDLKEHNAVTPIVTFEVSPQFKDIDKLRCALQIYDQVFISEPVKGDELPQGTRLYFDSWKQTTDMDDYTLVLPNNIEKLQQIKIKVWTEEN